MMYGTSAAGNEPADENKARKAQGVRIMARTDSAVLDTEATVTEQPSENGTEGSKRKRVDVEALAASNPNEKVIISFHVPAGLKLALKRESDAGDVSEAQFVREMLAQRFSYEIPAEFNERKHRSGKYAGMTEEEKKAAIAKENEAKRENVTNLLAAIQTNSEAAALLASMGIDVNNLPKPRAKKDGDVE